MLHAFETQNLSMQSQCLGQARAETLRLSYDRRESANLFQVRALAEGAQRLARGAPELNLALDDAQFRSQQRMRCPQLRGHATKRCEETQTPFETNDQDIQGIGQRPAKTRLAGCFPPVEPETWANQACNAKEPADDQPEL